MIYSVNFIDLAEKISPHAFAKYLKDTGWTQFETKRDYIKIFQYEKKDDFFQVTVPTDKNSVTIKQRCIKQLKL